MFLYEDVLVLDEGVHTSVESGYLQRQPAECFGFIRNRGIGGLRFIVKVPGTHLNFYLAASSVDEDSANVSTLYNGGFWNKQGSAVGSTDTVLQGTNTTFWWYSREYPTGNDNAVISAGSYVFNPYKIAAGTGAPAVFIYTPEVGYCTGGCDEAGDYTMIVTGSQQTWARNTAAGLRSVTIGNGGSVAFNVHNKGRLYLKLTVTTNDTTYGMGYNGSSGNYITNLQTPNLTIPENIFLLLLVVPFIPFLVKYSKRKGRHYSVSF